MKENNDFEFSYVAPTSEERREIESIRRAYLPQASSDLDLLRKLDKKVKNIPVIFGLTLGVFGILMFGLGLSMILEWYIYLWGVVVCVVSCVPMSLAYYAYTKSKKALTEKYSDEIINLSNKLLNDEEVKENNSKN